jgi:GT2 family glycosyltransferase
MSREVDVSIIIPTYNRKEELKQLLAALREQTLSQKAFELIIVDDGSNDSTPEFLQREKERGILSFAAQLHRGPGAARNEGMKLARGNIFVFTDTDCIPHRHWLESLLRPFEDETAGAAGGPEIPDTDASFLPRCFQFVMTSPLTTGGLRGAKKRLARYYPRTFNMAISRKAYEKVGGFREWFHGEDVEMSFRIKEAGFKLLYCEDAKIYHRRSATFSQFFFQLLRMGEARWLLFRTHRKLMEPLFLVPPLAILLFIALFLVSPFSPAIFSILKPLFALGIIYLAIIGISAWITLKSAKAFFLAPLAFICQQVGYGVGFLYAAGKKKN